jgi:CubicO group peptidase (beta-lactamase class C family)
LGLSGGALLLRVNGETACEAYFGTYNEQTVIPVVSAAKWLSAATILTLVDDGTLSLDDPASKYLPYFTGDKAGITLRQLLSHTSGIPPYHDCMFMKELTLDQCVRRIAEMDLLAPPGAEFNYSGAGFSVAGRMAEVASGQSWAELFQSRIADPLHLTTINYGDTQNPVLSEGYTVSSLNDYGTFLQMILDAGVFEGRQVLSAESIAEMRRDQRMGAALNDSPRGPVAYGLGVWLDRLDDPSGEAGQISSPGGGGFVPWVDFDRKVAGIFMVYDRIEPVWGMVQAMQQITGEVVDEQAR